VSNKLTHTPLKASATNASDLSSYSAKRAGATGAAGAAGAAGAGAGYPDSPSLRVAAPSAFVPHQISQDDPSDHPHAGTRLSTLPTAADDARKSAVATSGHFLSVEQHSPGQHQRVVSSDELLMVQNKEMTPQQIQEQKANRAQAALLKRQQS